MTGQPSAHVDLVFPDGWAEFPCHVAIPGHHRSAAARPRAVLGLQGLYGDIDATFTDPAVMRELCAALSTGAAELEAAIEKTEHS